MRDIPFPKLGKGSKIDVLIGSDYNSLLFPMKEVHGGDNEPIGNCVHWGGQQLVPLVHLRDMEPEHLHVSPIQRSECSDGDLNYLLKQFRSIEAIGITPQVRQPLSLEEKLAFDKVNKTIGFDGERYEVAVP